MNTELIDEMIKGNIQIGCEVTPGINLRRIDPWIFSRHLVIHDRWGKGFTGKLMNSHIDILELSNHI